MLRTFDAADQKVCRLLVSFAGPAGIRAVLHFFPVLGPLLAPFKGTSTSGTDLGCEAVLGLSPVSLILCHNPHLKGLSQVERCEGLTYPLLERPAHTFITL